MLISLEDITIQAGGRAFFAHTGWEIEKGQHWAILGPTGAGKTMLTRAIARKVSLSQGRILYFFDREVEGRPYVYPDEILTLSAETHQNFLRQYAEYYQARWQSFEGEDAPTVLRLLSDGHRSPFLARPDTPFDEQQRAEVVELLKIGALLERKVHSLSHGESRKVLIARLLLRSPRLLILDDPFTGLDQLSRERLAQAVEEIIRRGSPQILLVCSRVEELPEGITHLLLVKDGQVALKGERAAVIAQAGSELAALDHGSKRALFQDSGAFDQIVERYSAALEQNAVAPVFIDLRDVSVTYGSGANSVTVLKNIRWQVRQGERWALSGENGAGKTTLLSLILADNPQAYKNEIYLFGRERGSGESIWEIKQNIGWVSPELHIYYPPEATCLEVIGSGFFDSVGLHRRCSPAQSALAAGWLAALGMPGQADQPFHTLSTGQQRLVLLARALVKNPPLLILDEPCQGLDEAHRRYFLELIDRLCARTWMTLVYVTHYRDEIPAAITHQLRLVRGQVE